MSFNPQPTGDSETTPADSPLVLYTDSAYTLSAEAKEYGNKKTIFFRVKKGDLLVRSGDVCSYIYYVQKGILRGYVQDGKKEITTWITAENELVTSITSFHVQQPSFENIHAIEDCELYGIHYNDLQYLYINHPEVNVAGRKLLERYYRDAEERAYVARLSEATSKYQRFTQIKPYMLNRVPLKFIASYLGMTLETLSRIRSRLSQAKQSS
jgi:CRP-like cAMP-binding protein